MRDTIKVMEAPVRIFLRAASSLGDPAQRRIIGVWNWVRLLQLSIRQMYKLPRECTREDLDGVWAALMPYWATTWVVSGGGLHQRSAARHALEDVVYTQLCLAREAEDLWVTAQKISVVMCPDATPL